MLDRRLIEDIANRLGTDEGLVEKDWHIVRALAVLAALDHGDATPVFSGGTSLSKGWGIIKRFSEDIDFKIGLPPSTNKSQTRRRRSLYGDSVVTALRAADFELSGEVRKGNNSQFFAADFIYPSSFAAPTGLRPHIRVEMTFSWPALPTQIRPVQSLISTFQNMLAEVEGFACVDPVETAADKLSALAWRTASRDRQRENDDPSIVRHLHDLAALETYILDSRAFRSIVLEVMAGDSDRGDRSFPSDPHARLKMMLERLENDALWSSEYNEYVANVSFAPSNEQISFVDALAFVRRLVTSLS